MPINPSPFEKKKKNLFLISTMVDRGILDNRKVSALFIDPRVRSQMSAGGKTQVLPEYFRPGNWDVICHSGKDSQAHGNSDIPHP
jgi:hypothetical protein